MPDECVRHLVVLKITFMGKQLKLAILDLYDNTPNQGMRAIREIVQLFDDQVDWKVFDVRAKNELPDTSYDIYISSGGPGDPRVGDNVWDKAYFELLDKLWAINEQGVQSTKYLFLICHSFQMACHHWDLGEVKERRSSSFGTFPIHRTPAGWEEPLFQKLPAPIYVADFRDYQVIEPNQEVLEERGISILALEKIRPTILLERAVMAIRFSDAIFGTQFHPEADPEGMLKHFSSETRKQFIIEEHGEDKYDQMMADLTEPTKIELTHKTILPSFIDSAITALTAALQPVG